jgi:hypothetical protein
MNIGEWWSYFFPARQDSESASEAYCPLEDCQCYVCRENKRLTEEWRKVHRSCP